MSVWVLIIYTQIYIISKGSVLQRCPGLSGHTQRDFLSLSGAGDAAEPPSPVPHQWSSCSRTNPVPFPTPRPLHLISLCPYPATGRANLSSCLEESWTCTKSRISGPPTVLGWFKIHISGLKSGVKPSSECCIFPSAWAQRRAQWNSLGWLLWKRIFSSQTCSYEMKPQI